MKLYAYFARTATIDSPGCHHPAQHPLPPPQHLAVHLHLQQAGTSAGSAQRMWWHPQQAVSHGLLFDKKYRRRFPAHTAAQHPRAGRIWAAFSDAAFSHTQKRHLAIIASKFDDRMQCNAMMGAMEGCLAWLQPLLSSGFNQGNQGKAPPRLLRLSRQTITCMGIMRHVTWSDME